MVIHGASAPQMSELAAFIELAKDPKGYEEKLKAFESAKAASEQAASEAAAAEEKAKQAQASADARIAEANAIMAGAKKGQADLEAEKQALAKATSTARQEKAIFDDAFKTQHAALGEREKAIERREIAVRAREEKVSAAEVEVSAIKSEYEAKLANLRKAVA